MRFPTAVSLGSPWSRNPDTPDRASAPFQATGGGGTVRADAGGQKRLFLADLPTKVPFGPAFGFFFFSKKTRRWNDQWKLPYGFEARMSLFPVSTKPRVPLPKLDGNLQIMLVCKKNPLDDIDGNGFFSARDLGRFRARHWTKTPTAGRPRCPLALAKTPATQSQPAGQHRPGRIARSLWPGKKFPWAPVKPP